MSQPIDVTGTDNEVAAWIWRNLVPKSGQADTVQGELLRAVEKLRWEAQTNGNINWDEGFEILIAFLEKNLLSHPGLDASKREVIHRDLERLLFFASPDELENGGDPSGLPHVDDESVRSTH